MRRLLCAVVAVLAGLAALPIADARAQGASLLEVRLAEAMPSPHSLRVAFRADTLALEDTPVLTDEDFTIVEPFQMRQRFFLRFRLTEEASQRLHARTCKAVGRKIVFLLEGRVVNAIHLAGPVSMGGDVEAHVPAADVPRLTSMIRFQWNDPGKAGATRGQVRQPC